MKILVVSHACVSPINQDFFSRVAALSRWDITIMLPAQWKGEYGQRRAARWHRFGGRLIPVPVLLSGNIPLHVYAARVRRILAQEQPDAIYVHHEAYAAAAFQIFLANARGPRVPIGFFSWQNLNKRYPWPFRVTERFVYRNASFAIAGTTAAIGVLRNKGYRAPAHPLSFGVDTGLYQPNGEAASSRRDAPLAVGYVGRITPEKGVDTLMAALQVLGPNRAKAVVVGDGPAARTLKKRAETLGLGSSIRWLGYVPHDQMPAVYRTMDVLAVPSRTTSNWTEQFGLDVKMVGLPGSDGTPTISEGSLDRPPALLEWRTSGTAYRVVALNYGIRPAQLKRLVPAHHQ